MITDKHKSSWSVKNYHKTSENSQIKKKQKLKLLLFSFKRLNTLNSLPWPRIKLNIFYIIATNHPTSQPTNQPTNHHQRNYTSSHGTGPVVGEQQEEGRQFLWFPHVGAKSTWKAARGLLFITDIRSGIPHTHTHPVTFSPGMVPIIEER